MNQKTELLAFLLLHMDKILLIAAALAVPIWQREALRSAVRQLREILESEDQENKEPKP